MSKRNNFSRILRIGAVAAFFAALSIVLGKYLAIGVGEVLRFSFENLPIIFVGFAFGPIAGALCGIVADLVGCVLVGYAINPVITVGAAVIGALSGIYYFLPKPQGGVSRFFVTLAVVFTAHTVGSVIIKTAGLSAFYDMPYAILMLWRALNYIIILALESPLVFFLINNKPISREISRITMKSKR